MQNQKITGEKHRNMRLQQRVQTKDKFLALESAVIFAQ